jgi:hypothetical protein
MGGMNAGSEVASALRVFRERFDGCFAAHRPDGFLAGTEELIHRRS